jgi:hypothetical protein
VRPIMRKVAPVWTGLFLGWMISLPFTLALNPGNPTLTISLSGLVVALIGLGVTAGYALCVIEVVKAPDRDDFCHEDLDP